MNFDTFITLSRITLQDNVDQRDKSEGIYLFSRGFFTSVKEVFDHNFLNSQVSYVLLRARVIKLPELEKDNI